MIWPGCDRIHKVWEGVSKMEKLSFYFALWSAKAAQLALRIIRRGGTTAPGKVALAICPDFLSRIGRPDTLIGVTGTNGKTTVSNMLCDIFESMGMDIVSNREGANIDAGAATSLVAAATPGGKCRKKLGVLEMDERSAARLFPVLKPDSLIVTNLFRDSMRRNAHPEYIAALMDSSIDRATHLILNADDPISSSLAPLNSRTLFSVDKLTQDPPLRENLVQDVQICPVCGERIIYDFRRYHHIGKAHCDSCGWHSPDPDYLLVAADEEAGRITVMESQIWYEYPMPSGEIYNLYNALAAVTLLRSMGYAPEVIAGAMQELKVVQSRLRSEEIGRWQLTESMAKGLNAVACSRNFDMVSNIPGKKAVVLMLDDVFDEKSSSENIAWLYDADFEFLCDDSIVQILAVGKRCLDTRLRLLLAGADEQRVTAVPKAADAASQVKLEDCEKVFVLFEVYRHAQAMEVRDAIAERMRKA